MGKRKERKKEERKVQSRTRTQHIRLVVTLPNHYTTNADYVILVKSFWFNAFPVENPPANAVLRWSSRINAAIDS